MLRILYGVSPIGLGHATRAQVVVGELKNRGAEVLLFSGGKAAEFLAAEGLTVEDIIDDPVPSIVNGEMRRVALWYLRSWLAYRRSIKRTEKLFQKYDPDIVVCDEEFTGLAVAGRRGKKRVFVSDELKLGFARSWIARSIERRVERWYNDLQTSVDLLLIPDFGEDSGNRKHVGPIVRAPTLSRDEARKKYGLPAGPMVLFSMSGSGIGGELAAEVARSVEDRPDSGYFLAVTGNRGARLSGKGVFDLGVVPDNQNLVASADLVVSTAGKSTIDEAAAVGVPIIVIPIRYHAEQERNAKDLGFNADDAKRLGELIRERLGKKSSPKEFLGEVAASEAILSLLKGS